MRPLCLFTVRIGLLGVCPVAFIRPKSHAYTYTHISYILYLINSFLFLFICIPLPHFPPPIPTCWLGWLLASLVGPIKKTSFFIFFIFKLWRQLKWTWSGMGSAIYGWSECTFIFILFVLVNQEAIDKL